LGTSLENIKLNLKLINPKSILERGYIFAQSSEGKIITRKKNLKENDLLKLTFYDGDITTEVRIKK